VDKARRKQVYKEQLGKHGCKACALISAYGSAQAEAHTGGGPYCPK
jgi:hypothetical protein